MLVSKLSPTFFLKPLTEGAATTETGSLFQHFSALTEKTAPLLRRQLVPSKELGMSTLSLRVLPYLRLQCTEQRERTHFLSKTVVLD